ncbi:hypothetical protein ACEWY4_023108 [Coilia grayii]|uniref:C-type lectin domain-containing protein n=1 Tax=Coilia grayii TaxID=363190 RepID=A0ABD1J4K7_9TELE
MLLNYLIVLLCGQAIAQMYSRKDVLINESLRWSEAQSYCRQHYTDLSTYKSDWEQELLPEPAGPSQSWIGLHLVEESWQWIDGKKVTFKRWHLSEPNGNGNEKCAFIKNGFWFDVDCNRKMSFLCFNWTHKLILVREKKTWEDALIHCRSHHTDLASLPIRSQLLQAMQLSSEAQTPNVWTSLRFLAGDWLWVDMNPMEGGKYEGKELPQCPSQPLHCGVLSWETKTVTNKDCLEKLNFICYEKIGNREVQ